MANIGRMLLDNQHSRQLDTRIVLNALADMSAKLEGCLTLLEFAVGGLNDEHGCGCACRTDRDQCGTANCIQGLSGLLSGNRGQYTLGSQKDMR